MSNVLLIAATLLAVIAALLGFEVITMDDPHTLGWLAWAFACYCGSILVDR